MYRRAAHIDTTRCRIAQRIDFGMRFPGTLGVAGRQDLSVANNDAADARIRTGQEQTLGGLIERSAHGSDVV
jgi:hypothetical protein